MSRLIARRAGLALRPQSQRPRAVALGYDVLSDNAPRVLATGEGRVAEKIIALAQDSGIPIHEDPALAAALAAVELDAEIPPELYAVVAEVLAFIYRVARSRSGPV